MNLDDLLEEFKDERNKQQPPPQDSWNIPSAAPKVALNQITNTHPRKE